MVHPPPTSSGADSPAPSAGGGGSDHDAHRRTARKLQKRRRDGPAVELPEPLKGDDSDDEASPNDVASTRGGPMSINMNQSIFGLIAAAGSKVDFNERFDDGSSSDEPDSQPPRPRRRPRRDPLSQTVVLQPPATANDAKRDRRSHLKRLSGHRLLKSFATLPVRRSKSKRESTRLSAPAPADDDDADEDEDMQQSESSGPCKTPAALTLERHDSGRLAPVMSRMLQARAEMSSRPSFDVERPSADMTCAGPDADADADADASSESSQLARRLKEIFDFDEPEEVVEGEPTRAPADGRPG